MQNLLRNLRFSFRMLLKNPGLTLTILLTLALGVGANTAILPLITRPCCSRFLIRTRIN